MIKRQLKEAIRHNKHMIEWSKEERDKAVKNNPVGDYSKGLYEGNILARESILTDLENMLEKI